MGWDIIVGDALSELRKLDVASVQTCITSPPYYGLRDYGQEGQIGLEPTPDAYVAKLVEVFREVKRVLRDDGTLWLNLGDSYCAAPVGSFNGGGFKDGSARSGKRDLTGHAQAGPANKVGIPGVKHKDLLGIPWMLAFALRADGWYLRSEIIWAKPNPMPESVTDRPTKAHEQVFLLSKSPRYYYDAEAIAEPGGWTGHDRVPSRGNGFAVSGSRNRRSVWTVATQPYPEAHFATFPPKLVEPMVLAGSAFGATVLDPFAGSGTTLEVAIGLGRAAIGIELSEDYAELARRRLACVTPAMFA